MLRSLAGRRCVRSLRRHRPVELIDGDASRPFHPVGVRVPPFVMMQDLGDLTERRNLRDLLAATAVVSFFIVFGISIVYFTVQPVLYQERVMTLVFGILLGFMMFISAVFATHLRSR
jgi:hypothetical protein